MDNSSNDNKSKKGKKIVITLVVILLIIIILLLLRSCSSDSGPVIPGFHISSEEEQWDGEQNKPKQAEEDFMQIPYYGSLWVTEEEPYVWFNNPETNNVFFSYQVLCDGEEIFHNDDYISPGKALRADLYNVLDKGEYTLTVNISAVDENGEACNGATQEAKLYVK